MELKDESDNVMTTEEMQKRTENILAQMDEKGISDMKLRKGVTKIKEELAAIAVAHNIRKMIAKGYCVCSKVAVG